MFASLMRTRSRPLARASAMRALSVAVYQMLSSPPVTLLKNRGAESESSSGSGSALGPLGFLTPCASCLRTLSWLGSVLVAPWPKASSRLRNCKRAESKGPR